jgi:hypothetical protein
MIRLNRYLYLVILLCFFLPFAEGCKWELNSPEEKAVIEKARADSIAAFSAAVDSSVQQVSDHSRKSGPFTASSATSPQNSANKILSAVFLPGGDYSGIFLVMIGWRSITGLTSLVPAFVLLIILIATSRKGKERSRRIFTCSLLMSVFLLIFLAYSFNDVMYGYWITLVITIGNTRLAYLNDRNRQKANADQI